MIKKVILCVLDGWGEANNCDGNAVLLAKTPNWDLLKTFPHTLISASGTSVGLPNDQMGNSEVGHMHIGAGRIIPQKLALINDSIVTQEFQQTPSIIALAQKLQNTKKACHVIGMLSKGGVHAHESHLENIIKIMQIYGVQTYIHAITDGRDSDPHYGLNYSKILFNKLQKLSHVAIASVSGRYFAMDRDNRWQRTKVYLQAILAKSQTKFTDLHDYLKQNYAQNIYDEFIPPAFSMQFNGIVQGDALFITHYRSDRIKQILQLIIDNKCFDHILTMTNYGDEFANKIEVIFPQSVIRGTLGEIIANNNCKQLRIAETEKYAHVTYFFNGGQQKLFKGEERILVPSPKVNHYVATPRMSADEITQKLTCAINKQVYDFILVNYANADMIGHTGNLAAAIHAVECIDEQLQILIKLAEKNNYTLVITADHGNIEQMINLLNQQGHTAHSNNLVPFIIVDKTKKLHNNGSLANVAPTILQIMNLSYHPEMTATSLLKN